MLSYILTYKHICANHTYKSASIITTIYNLENIELEVLTKLYDLFLPDFLLFGYNPKPLEDLIRKKTKRVREE